MAHLSHENENTFCITFFVRRNHHPDSKVHGANMGTTWGRQDPGGPHVVHLNLDIWAVLF